MAASPLEQKRSVGGSRPAPVRLTRFDLIDYESAACLQQRLAQTVAAGAEEHILMLQHNPVFTRGRRSNPVHLLVDEGILRDRGARVIDTDRGGEFTFHGPGQLVCYPILELRRHRLTPRQYLHSLEETVIRAVREFGIQPERVAGRPGIWVRNYKLSAVGLRVQNGVSTHGFSLNVSSQASWFNAIVACGLADVGVTSLEEICGSVPGMSAIEERLAAAFEAVFDVDLTPTSTLRQEVGAPGSSC